MKKKPICGSFPTNSSGQSECFRLATKHSLNQSRLLKILKIYTVPLYSQTGTSASKQKNSYTSQPIRLNVVVSLLVFWSSLELPSKDYEGIPKISTVLECGSWPTSTLLPIHLLTILLKSISTKSKTFTKLKSKRWFSKFQFEYPMS